MRKALELEASFAGEDYSRFRRLLAPERERLLARAARRVKREDAEDCVEAAVEVAFKTYRQRPPGVGLLRWLNRLLSQALRTRASAPVRVEDQPHAA
ncbi:MAG: hypothetical protein HYY16_19040 [Planctomycetes bacterium]|nr:hypothetical protein [Planctomycetota bacterium]